MAWASGLLALVVSCGEEFTAIDADGVGGDAGIAGNGGKPGSGEAGEGPGSSQGEAARAGQSGGGKTMHAVGGMSSSVAGAPGAAGADEKPASGGEGGETSFGQAGSGSGDACQPAPPLVAGAIAARCVIGASPVVDAKLTEWPEGAFSNTLTYAGNPHLGTWANNPTSDDANLSGRFAVAWDGDAIYVAGRINDNARQRPDTVNLYQNDAFEVFFDGDNERGNYGIGDWQMIVDTSGAGQLYHYPSAMPAPPLPSNVKVAVANTGVAANWVIEIRVPFANLGTASPALGQLLGFDVVLDDADTLARQRSLTWKNTAPNVCNCAAPPNVNPCEPYCNTAPFFQVMLGGR